MKNELVEAVRVYTRYDMPDENDDTRRARNERVGVGTPSFNLPPQGEYLWNWFIEIANSISRVCDGYYRRIPPSEFQAWSNLTKNYITSTEYEILTAMDEMFCREMNMEVEARRGKKESEVKTRLKHKRR